MDTIKEGFSFGIGSAVARKVVDGIMPSQPQQQQQQPPVAEKEKHPTLEFQQCMEDSAHNYEACKIHLQ
jgi:hypothetical protein